MTKLNTPRNNGVKEQSHGSVLSMDGKTEKDKKNEHVQEISETNWTEKNNSFSVIINEPNDTNNSIPTKISKWRNPNLKHLSNGNNGNSAGSLKKLGLPERRFSGVSSASSGSGAKETTSTSLSFSPRLKRNKSVNSKTSVSTDLLRSPQNLKTDKNETSCREIVTKVYQLWEPQLSSSYRPSSIRIPSAKVSQKQPTFSAFPKHKRKAIMSMISLMKKK